MQREPAGLRSALPFALALRRHALQRENLLTGTRTDPDLLGVTSLAAQAQPITCVLADMQPQAIVVEVEQR